MFDKQGIRKYTNVAERHAFERAVVTESDALRRAFCLVLLFSGCRISEALNLTPQHIDFANKTVVFKTLKRRAAGHWRVLFQ
jgi:integrase/recombinase XerD